MKIMNRELNKTLGVGFPILAAVALVVGAAVLGGVEAAFASWGMLILLGVMAIASYAMARVLRRSNMSLKTGLMRMLNKKLLAGFSILASVAFVLGAAVMGGIELALAAWGMVVLLGIAAVGIYTLGMALQRSRRGLGGEDLERPISEKDKRLIMAHIDELFGIGIGGEQGREEYTQAQPISEKDKRLIMAHIDELFEIGGSGEQGRRQSA